MKLKNGENVFEFPNGGRMLVVVEEGIFSHGTFIGLSETYTKK